MARARLLDRPHLDCAALGDTVVDSELRQQRESSPSLRNADRSYGGKAEPAPRDGFVTPAKKRRVTRGS